MVRFSSALSQEELINKWDEFTSISRFAGNDESLDLIFVSKRKGNKVRLVRRAKLSRDPFSCLFSGRIIEKENGSEIVGSFRKSYFDYAIVLLTIGVLALIRTVLVSRGEALNAINGLLIGAFILGVVLLLNSRSEKARFVDFISRITES